MSKPRLIASLVIALAVLVGTGWWAVKTFWFIPPLPTKTVLTYASFSPRGSNAPPKTLVVYTVGGDVKAPVPVYKPEPAYSSQARKDKKEGSHIVLKILGARFLAPPWTGRSRALVETTAWKAGQAWDDK